MFVVMLSLLSGIFMYVSVCKLLQSFLLIFVKN